MRRYRRAILLAVLLAALVAIGRQTEAVLSPACASLTPEDTFLWWWYGCGGKDAAGGGGGGVG